ncbi:MAG: helix-turn-helix domain-containing protein [Eubacteriales bacterium]
MEITYNFRWIGMGNPSKSKRVWSGDYFISPCNRLHIPLAGSAGVLIAQTTYEMKKGWAYILPSNTQMKLWENPGERYTHLFADFNVSPVLLNKVPLALSLDGHPTLAALTEAYRLALTEEKFGYNSGVMFDSMPKYVIQILKAICHYFNSHVDIETVKDERIAKAIAFICSHYNEEITDEDIARVAFVNSRHLIRLFRDRIGVTPYHYLTEVRLNMAVDLLERDKTVEEVGLMCGFKNTNTFRIAFKKFFFTSPSEYIGNLRKGAVTGNTSSGGSAGENTVLSEDNKQ